MLLLMRVNTLRARRKLLKTALFLFFIVGLILRVSYHNSAYQFSWINDLGTHCAYIQYVIDHQGGIPSVKDDWTTQSFEYPQLPLYYLITAALGNVQNWSWFGTVCSMASLFFIYRAALYMSSWVARFGVVIFWSIDPFFIVHSAIIGNDALTCLLGSAFFYFVMAINRSANRYNYWRITWVFVAALFTKLNAVFMVLVFPWIFLRTRGPFELFAWRAGSLVVLLFGWFMYVQAHTWTGTDHVYMNPFQATSEDVRTDYFTYFSTFRLSELIDEGQASLVEGETRNSVRYSFNTFVYGEFLVGSWDYHTCPDILWANRLLFIAGMMIPTGLILFFCYSFSTLTITGHRLHGSLFNKLACGLVFVAYCSSVLLMLRYTHTCHADPRLQFPLMPWAIYCFCRGWTIFGRGPILKTIFSINLVAFSGACAYYYWILFRTDQLPFRMY